MRRRRKHLNPAVGNVAGRGQQRDEGVSGETLDRVRYRWYLQLGEFLQVLPDMAVPAAKLGTRSHDLEPLVAVRLLYTTEPKRIDEDPKPRTGSAAMNPTDLEVSRLWP